jgi:N-acetylglucosamine-6-phosphate deacetylase
MERASPEIGIVTLASELEGGLDLIEWLTSRGHRVALGHSGATCEQALAAIDRGACHATHLFNCMPPFNHRAPGLVGAILQSDQIAAELICDGRHVHPAAIRAAVAAKGRSRIMAISDATAACGLPHGSRAVLGGQTIRAGDGAAYLDDGRLAGGTATMADAFRMLAGPVGLSLVDAARLCSTTPARELGLADVGRVSVGAAADPVVLDARLAVVQTYVGGELVSARPTEQ